VPRGKEFCPFENDYFELKEFSVVNGTRIHDVHPRHRATDGVLVETKNSGLFPVADLAFAPLSETLAQE
jgi:hypothetical protein